MNNLHLEYLKDTGKQPIFGYGDFDTDEISDETFGKIGNANLDIYKPEYTEWLENKLNNLK